MEWDKNWHIECQRFLTILIMSITIYINTDINYLNYKEISHWTYNWLPETFLITPNIWKDLIIHLLRKAPIFKIRKISHQFHNNEPVFLVSEIFLRYLLTFKDQILVLDFSSRYQMKNSKMHFLDNSETRR